MSYAADKAYAAAAKSIARVRTAGLSSLYLSTQKFRALESLPNEISKCVNLQTLNLARTMLNDTGINPVRKLKGLQILNLTGIKISDLGLLNLQDFTVLQRLYLMGNQVSEVGINSLSTLQNLRSLDVRYTDLRDLRPIIYFPLSGEGTNFGVRYANTPATILDPRLGELAKIEVDSERTEKTLSYLRSLPKYPAPLPWLQQDELEQQVKPAPAQPARHEPPLTRQQVNVKTSAAQIKVLLAQPRMTQITAKEVAVSIRAAIADVQRVNNSLPEPLLTIEAIAEALDNIGNIRIAPKQKDMVDDLKLRIAQLEAQVERLTAQLADNEHALSAAEAIARAQSFTGTLRTESAKEIVHVAGFLARAGGIGGIVYVLGATNPVVVAAMAALGALAK